MIRREAIPTRLATRTRLLPLVLGWALLGPASAAAATFTVTNTSDNTGAGSLRRAISDANGSAGPDLIDFVIPGAGPHTIVLGSDLPTITEAVTIDATTQTGWAVGAPVVELDGTNANTLAVLTLGAGSSGSTVRGLVINRSPRIAIRVFSSNNVIAGNFLGTYVNGTADALSRNAVGVYIGGGTNNQIDGTTFAGRNVISGNAVDGIQIEGTGGTNANIVRGNYIGLNAAGTTAMPNLSKGVAMYNNTTNNVIGAPGAGNVISGNGTQGIAIAHSGTTGNLIQGNLIGTDWTGTSPVPNGARGISVEQDCSGNMIGGTVAGAGNTIAFNGTNAVWMGGPLTAGNPILGNAIFSNSGMGIDLNANGVDLNDTGDGDAGSNRTQNHPVLSAAMTDGAGIATFAGSLNSNAGTTYRIEFFASTAVDPSGYGEGQRYLGFTNVTTDGTGNAVIAATRATSLTAGEYVTATATVCTDGVACTTYGDTSEFGGAVVATASLVVTTTSDSTTGSDTSSVPNLIANPGADGRISLREAIRATNNTAGADTIRFGIPLTDAGHVYYQDDGIGGSFGAPTATTLADMSTPSSPAIPAVAFDADYPAGLARSWYRIQLASGLPTVSGAVSIDASTQPLSNTAGPVVELNGASAGGPCPGTCVDGLGFGVGGGGSTVRGLVVNSFSNVQFNLFAGADGVTVVGNYIGTDVAGRVARGGVNDGVRVASNNNTIGGTAAADRNVISGNGDNGIQLDPVTGNTIIGNYIGTDATGTAAIGNATAGVEARSGAGSNTIGGTVAGAGNVLSGQGAGQAGIVLDAGTSGIVVRGNRIGTDAAGTAAVGNFVGVWIEGSGHTIGGTTAAARNIISGNLDSGILVTGSGATGNLIQGNSIGLSATGTALPNARGVQVDTGASGNTIGGTAGGAGNAIADNSGYGIAVLDTSAGNSVLGNAVYANGGLGIDLNGDGVTANDALDGDAGPNGLLNFPVIAAASPSGGTVTVNFGLDVPAGSYRVEFFKNPSGADASGYGEGEAFASSTTLTHPGGGVISFNQSFPGVAGDVITATATACTDGAACTAFGSTSELSNAVTAAPTSAAISGTVFEDVNYGGGAGRDRASASGVVRSGARVELYDGTGAFVSFTTTDVSGNYSFPGLGAANYTVRVVNSTVTSSRPLWVAALRSVQTYRTDASTGSAVSVTNYVGGQNPAVADAGNGAAGAVMDTMTGVFTAGIAGTAQSITNVTLGASNVTGVDFGFNFDTIVNTNDSDQGSLRMLLTNANTLGGDGALIQAGLVAGKENAVFMISNGTAAPGLRAANDYFVSGVATIGPASTLPTVTAPLVLDAQKQPGWAGAPIVELNGASAAGDGLTVSAGSSAVRGFVVNRYSGFGIRVQTLGGNTIAGNYVGTNATGTAAAANGADGISIQSSANNTVGGATAADRNVVSGNGDDGIEITGATSTGNAVQGNYVGLNAAGTAAVRNFNDGIAIWLGTGNSIGGTAAGAGNVISAHDSGIYIGDATASGNSVLGNFIGTDATGLAAVGNITGIYLDGAATTVGGTMAGARNVISGNTWAGLWIAGATGVVAEGNYIGLGVDGTTGVGNKFGVYLDAGASGNTIGGTVAGAGNLIARNQDDAIVLVPAAGSGNRINANSIYSNSGLAVDLNDDGVTANDLGDGDGGPNGLQNYVVLSAAATDGVANVHVAGSLNSGASATYRVEFFAGSAPDPSGHGEGRRYLGFLNVATGASGNAVFGGTLAALVTAGEFVSATATGPSGSTSEYAANVTAVGGLVVTTTADTVDGVVTSVASLIANPGGDGRISLREAITAANNTAGTDTIRFGIPLTDANHRYYRNDAIAGSLTNEQTTTLADTASASSPAITDFDPDYPAGTARSWYRIRPLSALPDITEAVTIDGTTEPLSSTAGPVIELEGSSAGAAANGLTIMTGEFAVDMSTVKGLVVDGFTNDGINLRGGGGFTVTGNYVGTDVSGTQGTVGNGASGIFLTSLTGATPTQIGGSNPADRNVISANGTDPTPEPPPLPRNGIYVYNYYTPVNTAQVRIQGNYIGTDVTGTVGLGVQKRGIVLEYTSGHLIGGSGAGEGNLISGNAGPGIDLNGDFSGAGVPTDNNTIEGNWIGTDAAGTAALPNTGPGIQMYGTKNAFSSASGNTIRGNVFAAATGTDPHGIVSWGNTDNNVFDGNFIGTDVSGTIDLGNAGSGIDIETAGAYVPTGNTIQNNVIRFNDLDGVRVLGAGAVATLTQNAISSNDLLGIDLGGDGVTPNDVNVLDADTGPNELMNFPTLAPPVETAPNTLSVNYGLDLAAGWYRIEFFENSVKDPSGYGEGELFASSVVVNHPGGQAGYSHSFGGNAGNIITATTTACLDATISCATPGSTSEFSVATTAVPTVVELMSFTATGADQAVDLAWQTGSELYNLGFHLYRGLTESGPWTRLNPSLIPGLGSSPVGASYSWHDGGLVNGTRYYYRLEDVDAASVSTFHGPVSAVPSPPGEDGGDDGGGDGTERGISCPSWVLAAAPEVLSPTCTRHGDPDSTSLQVLSRNDSSATLELHTGGFWALHDGGGTTGALTQASGPADMVRVFVPGLEFPADASAPALPLRRALVEAVVGRNVELVSAEALDLRTFPGLRPAAVGVPEIAVADDGTVHPTRRALGAPAVSRGYLPREVARLAGTQFQGERKSAVVEITPVRFAGSGQGLVLAATVRVRLAFTGVAEDESGAGSRGRSVPRRKGSWGDVVARLHTSTRGLHAVSFEQLFPQRGRGLSTAFLRLQRQGEAVPFHVEPSGSVFGPGSVMYFFADRTALSTDYSSEVAYELVRSPGVQMGLVSGAPLGAPMTAASTGFASFETNRIYQPGLLEAPDVWLWEAMASGVTRTKPFTLSGVDTSSGGEARLVVHLQGASASGLVADHHVRVSLNGVEVGEATFAGKRPQRLEVRVPVSLLEEGENELGVTNAGDTGVTSLVFLDRFEVFYPQSSTIRAGAFEGEWTAGGPVEVRGVSGVPVVLSFRGAAAVPGDEESAVAADSLPASSGAVRSGLRLEPVPVGVPRTDGALRWVTGFLAGPGSVRFQAEAGLRYLVVSPEGLLSPRIERIAFSTLRDATNQAEYLVIAPRAFLEAAQPLLDLRRGQGLSSRAVGFEEIASEFGHGQPSAEAIREFLSYAYHSWRRPAPRYVLLLGDSTVDPRRFVATSGPSPLPAFWTKTSYMWTVSDPALAAVNGDDPVPDLAIGRLPATTVEEAERLVSKVLAWEESGQDLAGAAVLVADNPDLGGDFEADVEDIRASFLSGRATAVLKVGELGAGTRGAILGAFDEGVSLMSYVGHGGTNVWAGENVLNNWDVPALRVQSRQPLLLTLNCLNGYFVTPNLDALPEALLKAEGRGAIGAFSPSGLSLDGPAHEYHRALMAELVSGEHARLGDAILAAQTIYAETGLMPELLTVYQLLGDPALKIR